MLNKSSIKRIVRSTLVGLIFGVIVVTATFTTALFPGLIIGIAIPFIGFFKELLFELSDARVHKKILVKDKLSNVSKKPKRTLSCDLLSPHEFSAFRHNTTYSPSRFMQNLDKKLDDYQDFFEKKDPLTGQQMKTLKTPVTIEGITKNHRWCITSEKEVIKKILYDKTFQSHPMRHFLSKNTHRVVNCYDGFPIRFHVLSMFARGFIAKEREQKQEALIKSSHKKDKMDFALSVGV